MRTKRLGNSDLEVSVVGLGCMMFGSMIDQDTTTACVHAALDAGINFFDTADIYGKAPNLVVRTMSWRLLPSALASSQWASVAAAAVDTNNIIH